MVDCLLCGDTGAYPSGDPTITATPCDCPAGERLLATPIENCDLQHPVLEDDPWKHRSSGMRCSSCMWSVIKQADRVDGTEPVFKLGRCRRHAPTMNGYPAVFEDDWCGDHKLDENKL